VLQHSHSACQLVRVGILYGSLAVSIACVWQTGFKQAEDQIKSEKIENLSHFMRPILGNRYGPGVSSQVSQGSTYPRLRISDVPPDPDLPQTTWGVRILTLHLNYVAGYTVSHMHYRQRKLRENSRNVISFRGIASVTGSLGVP